MATHTDAELVAASRDLSYEFQMLAATAARLRAGAKVNKLVSDDEQVTLNVLIEAFLVHARNLVVFLHWREPKHDHGVRARHFVAGWTAQTPQASWVSALYTSVSARIVHLSYERSAVDPSLVEWPFREIAEAIQVELSRFIRLVPKHLLDPTCLPTVEPVYSNFDPSWPRGATGALRR